MATSAFVTSHPELVGSAFECTIRRNAVRSHGRRDQQGHDNQGHGKPTKPHEIVLGRNSGKEVQGSDANIFKCVYHCQPQD